MNSGDETVESEKKRVRELARLLAAEAWNLGANPLKVSVEYEGAIWQVSVRVAVTEG